jgi:hypothetical protein
VKKRKENFFSSLFRYSAWLQGSPPPSSGSFGHEKVERNYGQHTYSVRESQTGGGFASVKREILWWCTVIMCQQLALTHLERAGAARSH